MMTREANIPALSDSLKFGVSTTFGLTNEPKFGGCFGERFSLLIKETDQTYPIPPFITASAHGCAAIAVASLQNEEEAQRGPKTLWVPGSSMVEPQKPDFLLWRKIAPWFHRNHISGSFLPSWFPVAPTFQVILLVSFRALVRPSSSGYSACTMKPGTVDRAGPCILGLNGFISVSLRGTQGRQKLGIQQLPSTTINREETEATSTQCMEQSRVERATRCLTEPHSSSSNLAPRPRMELHCLLTP